MPVLFLHVWGGGVRSQLGLRMAAIVEHMGASFRMRVGLWGGSFESTPGVEASCEAVGLVSLSDQPQFSGVLCVFGAHVLDVNLRRRGRIVDTGVRLEPPAGASPHRRTTLTWQAFRLSLISTWLVWEPTHMYTWWRERLVRHHANTNAAPAHVQISVTSLPLSSNMMSSSAKSSWQKSEHFSETEK